MLYASKEQFIEDLERVDTLFPSAPVFSRISRLVNDADAHVEDLVQCIEQDAGLAADVIRLSNSPHYGFSDKAASVQEATKRIGFNEVSRLAGVSVAKRISILQLSRYRLNEKAFFAASVSTALIMRELAELQDNINPHDAYTAGLLSIIGKIVISELMSLYERQEIWDGETPLSDWEKEVVGICYPEAGGLLLKSWEFDDSIWKAVDEQGVEYFEEAQTKVGRCLALTHAILEHCDEDLNWLYEETFDDELLEAYHLDKEGMMALLGRAAKQLQEMERALAI